jgi:hypothetical protein
MIVTVPISVGELLDKITILQIKATHTDNKFVHKELQDLSQIAHDLGVYFNEDIKRLREVNQKLWDIEDKLREHERSWKFDDDFIDLARLVYLTNDKRSSIKKEINTKTKSTYSEVKLY